MTVLIRGVQCQRLIDHYDEKVWRTWSGEIIEKIPIPVLEKGERYELLSGTGRVLKEGEF